MSDLRDDVSISEAALDPDAHESQTQGVVHQVVPGEEQEQPLRVIVHNAEAMLREARAAHARGWALTPANGKSPFLPGWNVGPALSLAEIERFGQTKNIALRCGRASGVLVLDDDSVEQNAAELLSLPPTVTVVTGRPRRHYYFRMPDVAVPNRSKAFGIAVEVKSDGTAILLPGSTHPDTRRLYRWLEGHDPESIALAEFPQALLDELLRPVERLPAPRTGASTRGVNGSLIERYTAAVRAAPEGERNITLNKSAYILGGIVARGDLDCGDVESALLDAALESGLTERESRATIASGLGDGIAAPLPRLEGTGPRARGRGMAAGHRTGTSPARQGTQASEGSVGETASLAGHEDQGDGAEQPRPRALALDDNYLVDAFSTEHGENVRYCAGESSWFIWDGKRWCRDATRRIEALARSTLDRVALAMEWAAAETTGEDSKAWLRRAKTVRSPKCCHVTLDGAAGTGVSPCGRRLGIASQELDDPARTAHLLNCANGVLDLRTFELLCHEESKPLLITRICNVKHVEGAQCPAFCAALERIFEADRDPVRASGVIAALQQAAGYSLSGEQTAHLIFVMLGRSGNNGKSFLVKVFQDVVGNDYVTTLHRSVLLKARGEQHPTGLMELRGRRIAVASEFADRHEFDGALLKSVSGNDQISGRHMRENFQTFAPTHHLWIATNHLPAADRTDVALWNRFAIFPFERTFVRREDPDYLNVPPIEREDPDLTSRVLATEREGILAWMVVGLQEFRRRGRIELPEVCVRLRGVLHRRRDPVEQWLDACCDVYDGDSDARLEAGAGWSSVTAELRTNFLEWCAQAGLEPISETALGRRLAVLGFPDKQVSKARGRAGLRLRGGCQ